MAAKLSSTNVLGSMDAKMLAMLLQSMGRGNDTILAHITPREAKKLKREGGRGSRNPETGLLEFDNDFGASFPLTYDTPSYDVPSYGGGDFFYGGSSDPTAGAYQGADYTPQADLMSFGGAPVGGGEGFQNIYRPELEGPIPTGQLEQFGQRADVPTPLTRAEMFEQGMDYPTSETATGDKPEETGLLGKLTAGDILKGALGAGTGLMGYLQQQRAMQQAKQAAGQLKGAYTGASEQVKQLASPYFSVGGTQLAQALQGQLDPARLRQLEITRAKLAQSAARTGGVGAIQAATAMERARQDAITSQQQEAFKLLGAGNDLAYKALMAQLQGQTGSLNMQLQLTQQAQQAAANLYSQIGRYVSGV